MQHHVDPPPGGRNPSIRARVRVRVRDRVRDRVRVRVRIKVRDHMVRVRVGVRPSQGLLVCPALQ